MEEINREMKLIKREMDRKSKVGTGSRIRRREKRAKATSWSEVSDTGYCGTITVEAKSEESALKNQNNAVYAKESAEARTTVSPSSQSLSSDLEYESKNAYPDDGMQSWRNGIIQS